MSGSAMSWWSAAVATWLVVWGAVAPVEAQAPVAAPNAEAPGDEEARALFRAGRAAFYDGRYQAVLLRVHQSYSLS